MEKKMKIAATLLALAVALPTLGSAGEGRYQGTPTSDGRAFYVIDTKTGKVRLCTPNYKKPPKCSAWSKGD